MRKIDTSTQFAMHVKTDVLRGWGFVDHQQCEIPIFSGIDPIHDTEPAQ